jgi:hypothetical protein
MKNLLPLGLILAALTFATACSDKGGAAENQAASPPAAATDSTARAGSAAPSAMAVTYTCPMHPEVRSDKPGKCPKCGMTLIKTE